MNSCSDYRSVAGTLRYEETLIGWKGLVATACSGGFEPNNDQRYASQRGHYDRVTVKSAIKVISQSWTSDTLTSP